MEYNTEKMFLFFKLIAFEQGTANSHNPEQDTCNRQPCVSKDPYHFKPQSGKFSPNHFS